ncbi:anti-sigma-I factor RsgI family protein [Rossellomorea marisflavi]|uniref:anti-sigma-I factor RsgI family protein n=1 Tax=Rossellomorea marisflavi TaxID=189381 RepID=UPI0011E61B59|nr:anti-sigma factor domain-containing protein [Rossellomorea marisflavi]TYO72092.1 anti-sigma factor domain-containing protein [Rossellomorea marisflavi]
MKKGIIMDIKSDALVMMTAEGEFIKGKKHPHQHYSIGEEIPFFPVTGERFSKGRRTGRIRWKVLLASCAVFALLLILLPGTLTEDRKAYAYVSLDINPSLELTLDEEKKVLDIVSYNEEGDEILSSLHQWRNSKADEVTSKIFDLCEELGYFSETDHIYMTSSFPDEKDGKAKESFIKSIYTMIEDENQSRPVTITYKEASREERKEAHEKGVTAGHLMKEEEKEIEADPGKEDEKMELKNEDKPSDQPPAKDETKKKNAGQKDTVDKEEKREEKATPRPKADSPEKQKQEKEQKQKEDIRPKKGPQQPDKPQEPKERGNDRQDKTGRQGEWTPPGQQEKKNDQGGKQKDIEKHDRRMKEKEAPQGDKPPGNRGEDRGRKEGWNKNHKQND